MALKSDLLPGGPTALWSAVRKLQKELRELRAARRLENATIGAGGVTAQAPGGGPSVALAAASPIGIDAGYGTVDHPPAVVFASNAPGEIHPGVMTAYQQSVGDTWVPVVVHQTADTGSGIAQLMLLGGWTDGDVPIAYLTAGAHQLILGDGIFYVNFGDGTGMTMDFSGARLNGEEPQSLPLGSGWSGFGGSYQDPLYQRMIDGMVQLSGTIRPGTLANGTVVATLPVGYRPLFDHIYKVAAGVSGVHADLYVHSSGTITIQNTVGAVTFLSLSGIRIPL